MKEIRLEPVTDKNRTLAERLEIYPEQMDYIESVKECMREADELKDWKPVCIVDGGRMIGFAMYGRICEEKYTRLWFDRFLIDRQYQGQGYAKRAIPVILREMTEQYPGMDIYLSVYEKNQAAVALYESYGFVFTGELDTKGEKVMVLKAEV